MRFLDKILIPNHSFSIDFNVIAANIESYKDTYLYKKSQELGEDNLAQNLALAVAHVINSEIAGFEVATADTGCLEVTISALNFDKRFACTIKELEQQVLNWMNNGSITCNR